MKYLILFLPLTIFFCCSNDKKIDTQTKIEQAIVEEPKTAQPSVEFKKYATVLEMLIDASDYSQEQGTLKVLSKDGNPLHIQISKPVVDNELEKNVVDQTKRDIVYVAFQSFAQTDIEELTITSVSIKFQSKDNYIAKYKLTVTINRKTATEILERYLNTNNFQVLYYLEGTVWLPSKDFSVLKFKNLDAMFADMAN